MEDKSDTEKTQTTSRPLVYKLIQRSNVAKMVWPLFPSKPNDPPQKRDQQTQQIVNSSNTTWTIMKPSSNLSNSGSTVVQNQVVHYNINQGSSAGSPSINDTLKAKEFSAASNTDTSGNTRKITPKYNISPLKTVTRASKIQFGDSKISSQIDSTAYSNVESLHPVRKLVLPSDIQLGRVSKVAAPSNLNSLPIFSNSEMTVTSSGKSLSSCSNRPSKDLTKKTAVPNTTPKGDEKDTDQSQKNSGIAVVRNQLVHYNIVTQGHPNMKLPLLNESNLEMVDQGKKFATSKVTAKYTNKKRIILSPNINVPQPAKLLVLPPNMESVDPTKKIILPSNPELTKTSSRSANLTSPNRFILSPDAINRGHSQLNQQFQSNDFTKKYIFSPNMTSPEHTNRFVLSPSSEAEKRYSNMESAEAANILVLLSNMDSAGANRTVTDSSGIVNGLSDTAPAGNANLSALPSNMDLDDEVEVVPPKATEIEVYDDDDRKSLVGLDFEMTELVSSADVLKSLIGYKNYNVLLSALCSIKDLAMKSKALAAFFSTNKEFRSAHSQTESVQNSTGSVESRNSVTAAVHTSSNETQTFPLRKQSSFTQTQTVILSPKRKTSFTQTLKQSPRKRTCYTQTETNLARGKSRLAQTQTILLARNQPQPGIFTSSPVKKKNVVGKVNPAAESRPCPDRDGVLDSETSLPEVSEAPEQSQQNVSEDPLAYDNNGLLGIHRSVLLHDFKGVRHWGETLRSLGHSVDQRSRPDGYTPLHLALLSGCGADILFQLLGHGASAAVPDGRGRPTLLLAAKPRAPRRGAPAPVPSPLLPLLAATQPQALELVCRQTDTQGNTTLMYCARQGWAEQVQLLLEHCPPAVVRLPHSKSGKTALSMAMEAVADRVSSGQPVEPALRCVELLKQALGSSPDSPASPQKPTYSPLQSPVLRKRNTRALDKEINASNISSKKTPIRDVSGKTIAKVAASEVTLNKDELKETVTVGDQVMGMPVQKVIPCNLKIIFTPSKAEENDKITSIEKSGRANLKSTKETEITVSNQTAILQDSSSQEKGANKRQLVKSDNISMADSPILLKKSRKFGGVLTNATNKTISEDPEKDHAEILNADVPSVAEAGKVKTAQAKRNLLKKSRGAIKDDSLNKSYGELRTSKRVADNADVLRLRNEVCLSPAGESDEAQAAHGGEDFTPRKPKKSVAAEKMSKIKLSETKIKQASSPKIKKAKAWANSVEDVQTAKINKSGTGNPDMSIVCLKSGEIIGNLEANTEKLKNGISSHLSISKHADETESNLIILNPLLGEENSLLKENMVKIKRHYIKKNKGSMDSIHRYKKTIKKSKPCELKKKIATSVASAAKASCEENISADSSARDIAEVATSTNKSVTSVSKVRNVGLRTVWKNYSMLIPLDDAVYGKRVVQVNVKNILYSSTLESIARDKFIQPRVVISPIINRSVKDFFWDRPSIKVRRKFDNKIKAEFDKIAEDIIADLPDEGLNMDHDNIGAAECLEETLTKEPDQSVIKSSELIKANIKRVSTKRKSKYEILAPLKNKWKVKLKLSPTYTKRLRAGGNKSGDLLGGEHIYHDDCEVTPPHPQTTHETSTSEIIATTTTLETEKTEFFESSANVNQNPKSIADVADVARVLVPNTDVANIQQDSKKTSSFMNVKKLSEQSLQVVNVSTSGSPSKTRVDFTNESNSSVTRDPEQSSDVAELNDSINLKNDSKLGSNITKLDKDSEPSLLGNAKNDFKKTALTTVKRDPNSSLEVGTAHNDPKQALDVTNINNVSKQSFDVTKLKKDPKQIADITNDNSEHISDIVNVKRDPKIVSDNAKLKKDPKSSSDVSKVSKANSTVRLEVVKGKNSPDVANVKKQHKLGLDAPSVSNMFNRTIPALNLKSPLPALGKKRRYSLGSIEHDLEIINRAVAMQEAPDPPPPVLSYLLLYPN